MLICIVYPLHACTMMNIIKCSFSENGFDPIGMEFGIDRNKMAQFIGRVVGTKMQKTAKVEVIRLMLHPLVLKVSLLLYNFALPLG